MTLDGIKPGQKVQGTLPIDATATTRPPKHIGVLELFVDGRIVARFLPGRSPQLDTTKLPDGYHELRIVAVNADAIQSRGRLILPIVVNNLGRQLELAASPSANVEATDTIRIKARQPGATSIVIRQNRREVARLEGDEGEAEVLAATLGRGPVVLQAESEGSEPALSRPIRLEIH